MSHTGQPATPRATPCASCPYRRGVPSGIWARQEYDKLPAYDGDIPDQVQHLEQASATFHCHQNGRDVCAGWLGHRDPAGLLAVRLGISSGALDPSCADYSTRVDLFETGAEAADHGKREITDPSHKARKAITKITAVRSRTDAPLIDD